MLCVVTPYMSTCELRQLHTVVLVVCRVAWFLEQAHSRVDSECGYKAFACGIGDLLCNMIRMAKKKHSKTGD